jgi:N-acetylmuramoyl-L-alanine amidase
MKYSETFRQSPNVSGNPILPTAIVLHHTAGSYSGSVAWCLNASAKVSYHCIVNTTGERTILARYTQRAWHAGKSTFAGRTDCNSFTLGVAVSGNTYNRDLTPQEIESVAEWVVARMIEFKIPIERVTTHRAISPGRKNDVSPQAEKVLIDAIKKAHPHL